MSETSIIIRTKNQERWLGEVLARLRRQTYQNFEIVIIDSGSTDRTKEIARSYNVRWMEIPQAEFTYPHALNVACRAATAEKYFCILSGHSLPYSDRWLEAGVGDLSSAPNVCGVYGPVYAMSDGTIWEKLVFNRGINLLRQGINSGKVISRPGLGVLGNTNAMIRRDLWERHPFDEAYAGGGEDGEWAAYWMRHGYVAIRDLHFAVYHSHGLGLRALWRQFQLWKAMGDPHSFESMRDYWKERI